MGTNGLEIRRGRLVTDRVRFLYSPQINSRVALVGRKVRTVNPVDESLITGSNPVSRALKKKYYEEKI